MTQLKFVVTPPFMSVVEKVFKQDLSYKHARLVRAYLKQASEEHKLASEFYVKSREGKAEEDKTPCPSFLEYLEAECDIPKLPLSILDEPKLVVTAEEVGLLELITE